jgi:ABC-type Fe3+-siderophore transport system permease subunit
MLRGVTVLGAVMIAGVLIVALATGTTDELPWGAIVGVLVIMAFAFSIGRGRARALHDDDDDDDET